MPQFLILNTSRQFSTNLGKPYNFSFTKNTPEISSKFQAYFSLAIVPISSTTKSLSQTIFINMTTYITTQISCMAHNQNIIIKINIYKHFSHILTIIHNFLLINIKTHLQSALIKTNLQIAFHYFKQNSYTLKHPNYGTHKLVRAKIFKPQRFKS